MFQMTLVNKDGSTSTHESEALLYATGRVPNTDTLHLENTEALLPASVKAVRKVKAYLEER